MKRAGSGAEGTVWVARDLFRGIDVAVKLLRAVNLGKSEIVAHLEREAEIAARMLSPHIVRVLGGGRTESHGPYVVYECLEGTDVAQLLATRLRLAVVEARSLIVQACRALARAHALGVLHRDIKPSNLFLADSDEGREPVLKVLDFGLASIAGTVRDPSNVVGTLEYIAPEVLFGESEGDARSDLYALGIVAYECFTGRVPFAVQSIEELVVAFASQTRAAPSTLRPGLPRELDAWFEKVLARDPSARFASAKEMADGLDEALDALDRTPPAPRTMSGVRARQG